MDASFTSPELQLSERDRGIDALRGISILLVILNHIGIRIPLVHTVLADVLPASVINVLNWRGYEAVFIFFVISGFLITGMRCRSKRFSTSRSRSPPCLPAGSGYCCHCSSCCFRRHAC